MKKLLSLLLMPALATVLAAADTTSADALWKAVDDSLAALKKQPESPPKSREEAIERFKKLLGAADEAGKSFVEKFPNDPRRWKFRMFEASTAMLREQIGMKPGGDMKSVITEIIKAADADQETKGEADAVNVLISSDAAEQAGGETAWMKQAEEHLKNFPGAKYEAEIRGKIDGIKMLAEIKTKPLDLKFTSVDGHEVDLSKMRGKVVLVDFWATWCGPCVGEVPNVVKTYEKFHDKGFEILGISLDSDKSKLEAFTKEHHMSWAQYFDGKSWENEISTKFGIRSIPAMWLLDKKGMVVSTNARGSLEELVQKHLAE